MSQRGHIRLEGRTWRLYYRGAPSPGERRRQRSTRLGTVQELRTRAEARKAADRFLEQSDPLALSAGAAVTWPAWCERYLSRHLAFQSKGTRATQRSIVHKHLAVDPALAGLRLHEITRAIAQDWILRQHAAGVAPSTVRARFAVFRRLLRAAKASGLAVTPISAVDLEFPVITTVFPDVRSKAIAELDVRRILEAAREPLATIVALGRHLGLRPSETLGLPWSCVDVASGRITIRQQALAGEIRPLKTRSSQATLQAPRALLARLRAYRETWIANEHELLFADEVGQPLQAATVRCELHELLEQLDIPRKGLHALRHACALAMARAGIDPEAIRRAMRHSSMRTTQIYLNASPADIAHALESASQLDGEVMGSAARVSRETQGNPQTETYP